MNKKYKSAFSVVCPSESSVERIFDMTKKRKITYKPFLIAAIITTLMAVSLVTANAATDGALVEKAEEVVENAVQSVKVLINGEEVNLDDVDYEHSSEVVDGVTIDHYSFELGENEKDGYVTFDFARDGVEINGDGFESFKAENGQFGFAAEVINENGDKVELNVPTTRAETE